MGQDLSSEDWRLGIQGRVQRVQCRSKFTFEGQTRLHQLRNDVSGPCDLFLAFFFHPW